MDKKLAIAQGKTFLGIELGSTRIKAVLIGEDFTVLAKGSHCWENKLENGYWTYALDDIHKGLKACYTDLCNDIRKRYDKQLTTIGAMGISAMMHGYLAFDANDTLLTPFRTWRNTTTAEAAAKLTDALHFNIPQRWSIAHLYQAVLNKEAHIPQIAHVTTLAGYIHYLLTGRRVVGIGEASGIFPVDQCGYRADLAAIADRMLAEAGFHLSLMEVFPQVQAAGEQAGVLTAEGAAFLDESGCLQAGVPFCPPEGDAGTGMVASNAVTAGSGNISCGTSVFAMPVLYQPLKGVYPEIDIVATPDGTPVAMVHCNNGCSELDAFVRMFADFSALTGHPVSMDTAYETLYRHAMEHGNPDADGITAYNFLSAEPVAGIENGSPAYYHLPQSHMLLGDFMRAQLMSVFAALRMGLQKLLENENIKLDAITAHGGLFTVRGTAQQILADALDTTVSVHKTASEGGPWGMALLAAYMLCGEGKSLPKWLQTAVFADTPCITATPTERGMTGYQTYMQRYEAGLTAIRCLNGGDTLA
ncbi:MAG: xylulokinase [Oscillospiraceae bacterium]